MRCAVGCGHVTHGVDQGYGLDTVRGDAAHPVSRGLACGRGISETADPEGEWLTRPLVRKDGELVRSTWEDALDRATDAIEEARAVDSDNVGIMGSGQQTIEAAYALGKLARGGLGTRNYDANTTLCMASAVTAYYDAFGSDAPPPTYDDIPEAETHLVWGANPAVAHPVMYRWIRESADDEDSELLVVDPVMSETAENADGHIDTAPGGDLALANAILARMIETDRVDDEFVEAHTEGFDGVRDSLPPAEESAERAGVSMEQVDKLAAAFEKDTLIYWGMGINQSVRGTASAGALIDLCLASGNMGPGCGPFSLTGQANSMGTRVCSSKGSWPGHREYTDPDERQTTADVWNVLVSRLPDDTGPGPVAMIDDCPDVLWTVATNPIVGMPDTNPVREQLEEAFVIVQDSFKSETMEYADVVLPAATWGESEGTTMNMERTVSRVRRATEIPPGVRTDLNIICTVGNRVAPDVITDQNPDPSDVFDEFAALTEGTKADCSGISYERLEAEHAVRWPAPALDESGGYRYFDPDAESRDEAWSFKTESGRARFSTAPDPGLPEPPSESYPLTLTTGREKDGYNTGIRSREAVGDDVDPIVARINPETLPSATVDPIRIETPRGSTVATVDPDEAVPEGMVWIPIHHPAANRLTHPAVDPKSAEPNFKQCAARLVAVDEEVSSTSGTRDAETPPTAGAD
ncbi:assimilatory nitrate reductase (ferredoxin) precursor [Halohasta litchfieldiae]|uniref:Assimilatory nitrate reductase (Ferredoxin) n=2 Tax=Halohasta litchfieldiae TaxID=1073996 RepID=A0A1H6X979_9EURY|nr:assimilatory nitrate reductase (ferredoxin) precursor [Halohasta litchfieldiae]